ncbi:MAG: 5-formyltetrahydrofolate cyclo-ligase [Spirochaetaceae bacterium]
MRDAGDELREQKRELRRSMTARLARLSADAVKERSRRVEQRVCAMQWWLEASTVFCYVSMPKEVQTAGILDRAWSQGKVVALPRVTKEGLIFHRADDVERSLVRGPLNILEPASDLPVVGPGETDRGRARSLVLVPGLAFDRRGWRLGRGKGYYDGFLGPHRGQVWTVALCFEEQLVDSVPYGDGDVPIDALATPDRLVVP